MKKHVEGNAHIYVLYNNYFMGKGFHVYRNAIVEAHCYFVDIGRIDHEQIRSRINNNDCRTFRP